MAANQAPIPSIAAERCETCRFRGERPQVNPYRGTAEFADLTFACKRRAPVVTGGLPGPTMTVWPMITRDDFCGEYQEKPHGQ